MKLTVTVRPDDVVARKTDDLIGPYYSEIPGDVRVEFGDDVKPTFYKAVWPYRYHDGKWEEGQISVAPDDERSRALDMSELVRMKLSLWPN